MTEAWKTITGYDGLYEVSDKGRVRSYAKKGHVRILRQAINKKRRYPYVTLSFRGVRATYYIHRLVLLAFVGNPERNQECRHMDGNRSNNN